MPTQATVGRNVYESTNTQHAEELLFKSRKYDGGNLDVDLSAWPCTGERGHNCHQLFISQSRTRVITVRVAGDHGGYARNHNRSFGASGTITYNNGAVTYS